MTKGFYDLDAVLFDFDGTLVDSMKYWSEKMFSILRKFNIPIPDDLLSIITPLGDVSVAEYYINNLGVPMTVEEMIAEMDSYAIEKYRTVIGSKPFAKEILEKLKECGIKSFLLTASPRRMFEPCLTRLGFMDYFTETWSCEDFHDVKSNPVIYKAAADAMNTEIGKFAFVDDNCNALAAAKKAGVFTVGIYDSFSDNTQNELKAASDIYIKSFDDLLK